MLSKLSLSRRAHGVLLVSLLIALGGNGAVAGPAADARLTGVALTSDDGYWLALIATLERQTDLRFRTVKPGPAQRA